MFRIIQGTIIKQVLTASKTAKLSKSAASFATRAFSCTSIVPNTTRALIDVLNTEFKIATEIDNKLKDSQAQYLTDNGFKVSESNSSSNVQLYKKLDSGEELRVFFDVDEVTNVPIPPSEGLDEGETSMESEFENFEDSFVHVYAFISKPESNDGLFFDMVMQGYEEGLSISSFNYKPNASEFLARIESGKDYLGASEYAGPPFSMLDEALQLSVEKYLEEKGVDTELSELICSYAEVKEENLYRHLLEDASKFLQK